MRDGPDPAPTDGRPAGGTGRNGVACIAAAPWNPYLDLLYTNLAAHGLFRVAMPSPSVGNLWRERHRVAVIHFHWPEGLYRHARGPRSLRAPLSWIKLGLFGIRLSAARLLGYRIGWTVHQVSPHDLAMPRLDLAGANLLACLAHVLLAHDTATAEAAAARLRCAGRKIEVVRHGSYIGVYPPGRSAEVVRGELGIAPGDVVFLSFGELRKNKGIELLLEAWARADLASASLVIAGNPKDPDVGKAVTAAAHDDPRITAMLGFCPVERVAETFGASDVGLLTRTDGGTSGSIVLALSLGLPVVYPDQPAYREMMGDSDPGWRFQPGDIESLRLALVSAAADPSATRELGRSALAVAESLAWPQIAARTAALLLGRSVPA